MNKLPDSSRPVIAESAFSLRTLFVFVLLLGVLGAVYWPTLSYGPVVDDPPQIELVRGMESFGEVFRTDAGGLFRPVKNTAFYLFARDGELFDLRVASLTLFAAYATAFYLFACLFMEWKWALFSALFLALHPAQVASVIFPSAINNIFAGVCILIFSYVAVRFLLKQCGALQALASLVVFGLLALFGYELGVVIAPMSVLLAFYYRKSAPPLRSACLIGLSLILVLFYLMARGNENAIGEMTHPMIPPMASDLELLCSAPYYTLKHLFMAIWPLGQGGILLTDDPRAGIGAELPYWGMLVLLLVAGLIGVERWQNRVAFGLLFFVCAMTPLSNWIPLRNGPITNYYLLLPLCGVAIAVGVLFERYSVRCRPWVCLLLGAGLLGASAIGGSYRASWWDSQYSIYEYTARNHEGNWVAWNNWGVALIARGESEAAYAAFERSAHLADWYVEPFENQLWLLLLEGRYGDVIDLFEARGDRSSSGIAAAAVIAYSEEGHAAKARDWATQVQLERLKPVQARWIHRVAQGLWQD